MTRPFDKHLDNDELDALVLLSAQRVPYSGFRPAKGLEQAQTHVESCELQPETAAAQKCPDHDALLGRV